MHLLIIFFSSFELRSWIAPPLWFFSPPRGVWIVHPFFPYLLCQIVLIIAKLNRPRKCWRWCLSRFEYIFPWLLNSLQNYLANSLSWGIYPRYRERTWNGFETEVERTCRVLVLLESEYVPSGGVEASSFYFLLQNYSSFPTQSFQLSDFSVKIC